MAATSTTPLRCAYATARSSAAERDSAPRLMLITSAPWSVAQTIPAASREPWCRMLSAVRIGMIRAPGAMPAMPSPLSVAAPSTPATFVPWLFCVSDVTVRVVHEEVEPLGEAVLQVGVVDVDADVDVRDHHALAGGERPGAIDGDPAVGGEVPLLVPRVGQRAGVEQRVVRRVLRERRERRGRHERGERQRREGAPHRTPGRVSFALLTVVTDGKLSRRKNVESSPVTSRSSS